MLVQAKTGTGKTLVFAILSADHLINAEKRQKTPHVVIVSPTREIAMQSYEVVRKICSKNFFYGLFVGGVDINQDKKILRKGCQVAVGTSGRLAHLTKIKFLNLKNVTFFVLDEADKLMEDSYRSEINYLFSNLTKDQTQVCVFSATYPRNLDQVLCNYMKEPSLIRLNVENCQLIGVKQYLLYEENKFDLDLLLKVLKTITFTQCLIFTNDQKRCKTICNYLNQNKLSSFYFSALLSQEERFKIIKNFKSFSIRILVSSDLSSRGIDVDHVNLIINLGCIKSQEQYLHRIGRAGRFGTKGAALTIITDDRELYRFKLLVRNTNLNIKILNLNKNYANDLTSNFDFFENCAEYFDSEVEYSNNFFTNVNNTQLENSSDSDENEKELSLKLKSINITSCSKRTKYYLRNELLAIRNLLTKKQWSIYGQKILGFDKSETLNYLSKQFYSTNVENLLKKKQNFIKSNNMENLNFNEEKNIKINSKESIIKNSHIKNNPRNLAVLDKPNNSLKLESLFSTNSKFIYSKNDLYAIYLSNDLHTLRCIFMQLIDKKSDCSDLNEAPFSLNLNLKDNINHRYKILQKREENVLKSFETQFLENNNNVEKKFSNKETINLSTFQNYFSLLNQLNSKFEEYSATCNNQNSEDLKTEKPLLFKRRSREDYCVYIENLTKILTKQNSNES